LSRPRAEQAVPGLFSLRTVSRTQVRRRCVAAAWRVAAGLTWGS
jgi:hypothetical protein